MKLTVVITILLTSFLSVAQETKEDCECPPPTPENIREVCGTIYFKEVASDSTDLSFKYQETLWRISCAKDGEESLEQARIKIQKM